ncbi:MAG: LysR substrate-binding domain-containing protein [Rhizomicrobium sp.]|nr:LysR substrate-binding domain-containing protein [Rhizomicrobium sp.]
MRTMRNTSIDLDSLRYFSATASAGNFGRAAIHLGVQTSTVSRRISQLEDQLGLTLFERGHFGIRLTSGGRSVMVHVRRALADLDAVRSSAQSNANGHVGQIRLGIRMPPIGKPLQALLEHWRDRFPGADVILYEMNERDIQAGIEERRIDAALMAKHTLWPHAVTEPIYREPVLLALPKTHPLRSRKIIKWGHLRDQTFLVQGWDESQSAREFYVSFLGGGVNYQAHAASKQSVLALVGAGFGMTLVTKSQAEVRFPGVVYRPVTEKNAFLEVDIVWAPENKEAVVGRFVAFMRDEARSRRFT